MLQRKLEYAKRAVAGGVLTLLVQNDGGVQWGSALNTRRGKSRDEGGGDDFCLYVPLYSIRELLVVVWGLNYGRCYRHGWVGGGGLIQIQILPEYSYIQTIKDSS